ncbi:MAG: hypothetical protein KKB31_06290 [Nanoarchaeota archaeon]|nr:hypothetical protein [Nanoarchaeota archaeon]
MANKNKWVTPLVIIAVIVLAILLMAKNPGPQTTEEIAKCIGKKSVVYERLGCHACENQQKLFGEFYEHITSVDCFFEQTECQEKNIEANPTWIINGEKYVGTQSIETLQKLTGC